MVSETIGLRKMVYYDSSCCCLQVQPFLSIITILVQSFVGRISSISEKENLVSLSLFFFVWLPRLLYQTLTMHLLQHLTFPPFDWLTCSGTTQGEIFIVHSTSQQVQSIVRKAHLGFVTALAFSHDSRL